MTITATNLQEFIDVIAGLVERGLTFSANAGTLEIRLLGSY